MTGISKEKVIGQLKTVAIGRLFTFLMGLCITVVLARTLTTVDFAVYGVIATLVTILAQPVQLGFETSIVRFAAETPNALAVSAFKRILVGATIGTVAAGVGIAIVLACVPAQLIVPSPVPLAVQLMVGMWILASALNRLYAEALRGFGSVGLATVLSGMGQPGGVLNTLAFFGGLVLLVQFDNLEIVPLLGLSIGVSFIVALIAARCIYHRVCTFPNDRPFKVDWLSISKTNANLMVAQLFWVLGGMQLAVLVAGALLPPDAVADLVAVQRLSIVLSAPMTLLNAATPDLIVKSAASGDKVGLQAVLRLGSSVAFAITLLIAASIVITGETGIIFALGEDYAGVYPALIIVMLGLLINSATGSSGRAMMLLGQEKTMLAIALVTTCVSGLLMLVVAGKFGLLGLSGVVAFDLVAKNLLTTIAIRRKLGVNSFAYVRLSPYIELVKSASVRIA